MIHFFYHTIPKNKKTPSIKIHDPNIVKSQSHESSSPMFSDPIYDPLITFLNQAPILMDCSLLISITFPRWVIGENRKTGLPPETISSTMWSIVPKVRKMRTGLTWLNNMRISTKKRVWENSRWPRKNCFPRNNAQSNISGKTDPIANKRSPTASIEVFHIDKQIKLMPKVHSKWAIGSNGS